MKTDKQTTI